MRRPGRDRVQAADEGFSLVELLVAVTLMGIVVVVILSALGVLILSSREHRQMANSQVVLASAAEKVKAGPYVQCADPLVDTTYTVAAAGATQPTDWASGGSVQVVDIDYWVDGLGFVTDVSQCVGTSNLQRITLQVTSPDGGNTDTVSILKGGVKSGGGPGDPGGASPCFIKSPTAGFLGNGDEHNPVKVTPGVLETFVIHLEPGSCSEDRWPLELYIPGVAGLEQFMLVPNPTSQDPTWEAEDVQMPEATSPGWETKGKILVAIVYDAFGAEAGRFWLEVT